MQDIPRTPVDTLIRARDIALKQGLHYVYTGNVHHKKGDTTYCPSCHKPLIERDWYQINDYQLTSSAHCPHCNASIAGRFDTAAGNFGRHRIPVKIL